MSCAVPRKDDGSWDSCRRYNISIGHGGVECSPDEPRETIPCDEWVYDSTSYTKTAVSEVRFPGWGLSMIEQGLKFPHSFQSILIL